MSRQTYYPQQRLRLGRAADNDIVLNDLSVSRHHAELLIDGPVVRIVDLFSRHGTFVNGRAVYDQTLQAGDLVTVGSHALAFDGANLLELDDSGGSTFGASGLSVTRSGRALLDDVDFTLPSKTLMAVVGPSGAGKSTLIGALTGSRPATAGQVVYDGRDLYHHYAEARLRIGYVPQENILHESLTVQQALMYGAELRFSGDTTAAERLARVQEVAAELSLSHRLDARVSSLSGGERKRASTALELLTRPSLLFLDEPTSGLDTDLDREVMYLLRDLADGGRTVVVVTHNLEHLEVCDVVMVLARGGHVAYLGEPDGVFTYFQAQTWADVFTRLRAAEGPWWADRFRQWTDRHPHSYPAAVADADDADPFERVRNRSRLTQLGSLIRRQLTILRTDRTLATLLIVMPVLLALIARVVPDTAGLQRVFPNKEALQILLLLVIGATLLGSATAVRELVKERSIYQRERAVGLSASMYLTAKILVFGLIAAVQAALLTVLAIGDRKPADESLVLWHPTAEIALVVALVAFVSTALGLAISAAVGEESQTMPLLVLTVMSQLVLCGGLIPVVDRTGLEEISWTMAAKWGFSAVAATVGLATMVPHEATAKRHDWTWEHSERIWVGDVAGLLAVGVVAILIAYVLLRERDPRLPRARRRDRVKDRPQDKPKDRSRDRGKDRGAHRAEEDQSVPNPTRLASGAPSST